MNLLNLHELFKQFFLLDSKGEAVLLYPYQERVAKHLLSGVNVILRAPTGAGKTWAALLPFLFAREQGLQFADRMLYALPLRSLASQLFSSTNEACRRVDWRPINPVVEPEPATLTGKINITMQTGEQQDDPFFQGEIIFTTIDQLLSSYILSPVSLPGRLANINAGAMLGSLLVFDEFHLLEPSRSMGTAIEMLDRLNGYCRFVLMTATLSDQAVSWLACRLKNVAVVALDQVEIEEIEKRKETPTRRFWTYKDELLTAAEIIDRHEQRTLVLTNTVSRAQQIYKDLLNQHSPETKICLLHSRFFPADRAGKEKEILDRFGKERQKNKENFILVSTQVVEAGMDFSVDTLHSELAPINSLVQRAGRCARYGGEGSVNIYRMENDLPYDTTGMRETQKYLQGLLNEPFTYIQEREAVNSVLGPHEESVLSQYANLHQRRAKINEAIDGSNPGAREELIRDVNSINVIVTAQPQKIRFDRPGQWPKMLSVPVGTLRSFLTKAAAAAGEQWVAKHPLAAEKQAEEETQSFSFHWPELKAALLPSAWVVAVNPAFAHYSADLGLILGEAGSDLPVSYNKAGGQAYFHYRCETYFEHVRLVLEQYTGLKNRSLCAAEALAKNLGLTKKALDKAVRLALLFHDAGKLTTAWQQAIKAWQEHKTPAAVPERALAHADFNPETDGKKQREFPFRPPHALGGAFAVHDYLLKTFSENEAIAFCVFTAIARHHTGHAAKLNYFTLLPSAKDESNALLGPAGLPPLTSLRDKPDKLHCGEAGEFADLLLKATREEDRRWLPLYFHIVRQLRLADQAGSAEGGKK